MSKPEELVLKMCQKLNVQSYFRTLSNVWSELEINDAEVQKKTHDIINKITADTQSTLAEFVLSEQHTLCRFRIQKIRREIDDWWLKCHYSEAQRDEFQPYYSEDYSDQLLLDHQMELKKLQTYHSDNEQIFEAVDQCIKLHEKVMYLEAQDKNPNRLFENRGGQLLKDERDRKAARKDLPRLEKKVEMMTADFSSKYGREFTINGKSFADSLKSHMEKIKENVLDLKEHNTVELKLRIGSGNGLKHKLPTVSYAKSEKKSSSCINSEQKSSSCVKSQQKRGISSTTGRLKRFKPLNMQ